MACIQPKYTHPYFPGIYIQVEIYNTLSHAHTSTPTEKIHVVIPSLILPEMKPGWNRFHSPSGFKTFIFQWEVDMSRSSEENRTLPELWLNSPSAFGGGKLVDYRPGSHHRSHKKDSFLDGVLFCLTFSVSIPHSKLFSWLTFPINPEMGPGKS